MNPVVSYATRLVLGTACGYAYVRALEALEARHARKHRAQYHATWQAMYDQHCIDNPMPSP